MGKATILYATEAPSAKTTTEFCDMRVAYDTLYPIDRQNFNRCGGVHNPRHCGPEKTDEVLKDKEDMLHPAVRTHPISAKRSIYITQTFTYSLSNTENEELLFKVLKHCFAGDPELYHIHRWGKGDLLVWDNATVCHRGTSQKLEPHHQSKFLRATIKGDRP